MLQQKTTYPIIYGQHQLDLIDVKKNSKSTHTQIWVGREVGKVDMGRIGGWFVCDQNMYKIFNEGIHFLFGKN